ncbi:MAG TPA: hypothetical protein VFT53_04230 [Candidatus Saccharimonadales bacterium]|nr:hypothetical protein [Candidatus Saccharimonadales bacterium]
MPEQAAPNPACNDNLLARAEQQEALAAHYGDRKVGWLAAAVLAEAAGILPEVVARTPINSFEAVCVTVGLGAAALSAMEWRKQRYFDFTARALRQRWMDAIAKP